MTGVPGWRVWEGDVVHECDDEKHARQVYDGTRYVNRTSHLQLIDPHGNVIEEFYP